MIRWTVLLATLLVAAPLATGVPLPGSRSNLPPGEAPPPAPGATTPAPSNTAPAKNVRKKSGAVVLRLGARGAMVKDLQRALRRRGIKVRVDGSFGKRTRAAIRILQRRWRLKATGKANEKLLRRLGIRIRSVASSASPGATAGGARYLRAFPVQGDHTYFNDWGAPRGSRSHQGNDIMAAKGTPLVSITDAVVHRLTRAETGLGGIWVWLRDAEGTEYYYAHMDSIADGLEPGMRVATGQVIGTVGNTGDARYGADHLHFEIHPDGGGAVNPYSELLAVDPNPPKAPR